MHKKEKKLAAILLTLVMCLGLLPVSVFADDITTVPGALNASGGTWVFAIPEDAKDTVVLDFSGYLDYLIKLWAKDITKNNKTYFRCWDAKAEASATLPIKIVNSSGNAYGYTGAEFKLNKNAQWPEGDKYYYIFGKSFPADGLRPENIPKYTPVRTVNQPIQSLYNFSNADLIAPAQLIAVDKKIQEHGKVTAWLPDKTEKTIPNAVNTYGEYLLWYYGEFYGQNAASLSDLPMDYKLNILGFDTPKTGDASYNPHHFKSGDPYIEFTRKPADGTPVPTVEQLTQEFSAAGGIVLGGNIKQQTGAFTKYQFYFMETDSNVVELAQDVLYRYGLRFTFNADYRHQETTDWKKVKFNGLSHFARPNSGATPAEWQSYLADTGELGWSALCETDLSAEALRAEDESLTCAQKSIKRDFGGIKLGENKEAKFNNPCLTMPGYAVVNAHKYMAALYSLGLTVTLKSIPKVDGTVEYFFDNGDGNFVHDTGKAVDKPLTGLVVGSTETADSHKLADADIPEGYIFDHTDGDLAVTDNAETNIIKIYYAKDVMGSEDPDDPNYPGDNTPDYQQAVIEFMAGEHGSVAGNTYQTVTLTEGADGKYSGTCTPENVTVTADTGYDFKDWTNNSGDSVENPFIEHSLNGGDHIVYTAKFGKQGTGGTEPGEVNPSPYIPPSPVEFIKEHYAYIIGYPDGMVHPERDITRAETATIFFRMLTEESRKANWKQENPYEDVNIEDWFNNAVSTLTNAGILHGRTESLFEPNESITRAEFAAMAARFFEREGWDKDIPEDVFPDIKNHWAEEEISLAYSKNLINGYPDGSFKPDQPITRAEAVTIVNRVLERHPHKDHLLKDMIEWPDNMDKDIWYYADMQEATNSHNFEEKELQESLYENWTEILPVRDWAALEREWSEYNSSESPGEVVGVITRMIEHLKSA